VVRRAPPGQRAPSRPRGRPGPSLAQPVRTEGNTLDLRGQYVEDALPLLDAFLDRLLSEGDPAGFVLHGHGTGKLKAAVRDHLKASTYVDRSAPAAPEDGGDAFTVFWIKG
jgi:DNA mismatch repair protein MutS2